MGAWHGVELGRLSLSGERLTLRPWCRDDAPAVHQAMQDRSMHEFLLLPDPYTEADAVEWVDTPATEGRRTGTGLSCALVETTTRRIVGGAELRLPGPRSTRAEIGYAVYPAGRGNGYASEASRVLSAWAMDHGVIRVQIRAAVTNIASIKAASTAGFRFEGVARADLARPAGRALDAAVFARVRGDADAPMIPAFAPLEARHDDGVVRLRTVRPEDAGALFDEGNDPQSRKWSFSGAAPTLAEAAAEADRAQLDWLVGGQARMAIVDVGTGEVAGSLTVRRVGPPGVGGIGYGLRPAWRGRGYTARALRLVRRWAFDTAGFNRLELGAKAANVASQRAARSGGFLDDGTRIGRLRNPDGSYSDEIRFAAFSPE